MRFVAIVTFAVGSAMVLGCAAKPTAAKPDLAKLLVGEWTQDSAPPNASYGQFSSAPKGFHVDPGTHVTRYFWADGAWTEDYFRNGSSMSGLNGSYTVSGNDLVLTLEGQGTAIYPAEKPIHWRFDITDQNHLKLTQVGPGPLVEFTYKRTKTKLDPDHHTVL